MRILGPLAVLAGFAMAVACPPARADQPEHSATLHCDPDGNRALVVLGGTTEYANPPVPLEVELGLSRIAPAPGNICRLKDGREIKVKFAHDQTFPYGKCGADPMAFLSLWIGSRKVLSRHYFYGGCHQGLVLKAVLLDENRLTKCNISPPDAEGEGKPGTLVCADATDKLLAAQIDAVEYPSAGTAERRIGSIEVKQAKDRAFCERFIDRDLSVEPKPRMDGLMDYWGSGDVFAPTAIGVSAAAGEKIPYERWSADHRRFDIDNDGVTDNVLWFYGTSQYFDGDFFLVEPSEPTLAEALLSRFASRDGAEKILGWARDQGISIYSGLQTSYRDECYTHFWPIVAKERLLLWAWPTNRERLPTAMLYESGLAGKLTPICSFQRVDENF